MAWKIEYSGRALKSLKKLDRSVAQRVVGFMKQRVAVLNDPRILGKPLKGELGTFWRYRVGDYRLLCNIDDDRLVVLVAIVGHRRQIYSMK